MRWVAPLLVLALAASACSAPAGRDGPDAAVPSDGRPALDADVDAGGPGFLVQYADPDHGPFRGNTLTTIRGQGFLPNDEVWIGDRLVLGQRYIDSRRFEVLTPPGDPGDATIEIRRFIGPPTSRAMAFTYDAIAVDPPSGSVAGGTFVTITGFGTDFVDGATVLFDGLPATGVTVQNGQRLTGYAPPGIAGDADILVRTPTDAYAARRAYTYFTTGDPFAGGLSGGPLAGTLNVVVLDQYTKDGIPGAFVAVGDPSTTAYRGTTDALGQITFSGPDLTGPQTVTAWAADHEVGSFHCFDAANLTIWLRTPIPPPDGGPPPIGVEGSRIRGHVMFGDGVGLGSPFWNLVPEPRTPTEKKRIYVTSAASSLTGGPSPPLAPIDYEFDPTRLAWPYEIAARPGALAVVAVAGLYDPALDPDGNGNDGFEPFAVGLARGVLVGPGEDKTGVDIVVNIPLDSALRVQLEDPPALNTPGWRGPTRYQFRGGADLGGEGLVHFGKHGLRLVPGGLAAGELAFPPGTTSLTVAGVPALAQALADGSYAMSVGAYSDGGAPPYSVRVVRGVTSTAAPVVIGDFLPVPRAIDPAPAGVATARHLQLGGEPPAAAVPTFRLHMLSDEIGNPVWRAITCGAMTDVPMPDLSSIGVTYPPPGQIITWVTYAITTPAPYSTFSYRWFGIAYWQAYATDAWTVQFPSP
ncbi:MAG: IPT/TIG domain-containing protein [Myxococcales bacterium]|nr:IPT/TIG domain-containing protein [Myxococcales bacterium]